MNALFGGITGQDRFDSIVPPDYGV